MKNVKTTGVCTINYHSDISIAFKRMMITENAVQEAHAKTKYIRLFDTRYYLWKHDGLCFVVIYESIEPTHLLSAMWSDHINHTR